MSADVKNVTWLDFDRGCNSIQNQLLTFQCYARSGVREVASSSLAFPAMIQTGFPMPIVGKPVFH